MMERQVTRNETCWAIAGASMLVGMVTLLVCVVAAIWSDGHAGWWMLRGGLTFIVFFGVGLFFKLLAERG